MTYKKRRCSHCGLAGHNVRTCPSRSSAEKQIQKNILLEERKFRENIFGKPKRACSHCGEPGHTIRTCEKKKEDILKISDNLFNVRSSFLRRCEAVGFDVGCIIKYELSSYYTWAHGRVHYGLVTRIDWEKITPHYLKDDGSIVKDYMDLLAVEVLFFGEKIRIMKPPPLEVVLDQSKIESAKTTYLKYGEICTIEQPRPNVSMSRLRNPEYLNGSKEFLEDYFMKTFHYEKWQQQKRKKQRY